MNIEIRLLAFACTVLVAAGVWERCAAADEPCEPHWDNAVGQPGPNGTVRALTRYNGDLIAGGNFLTAGGQTVDHIARWDGSQWHPFVSNGHIGTSGTVYSLTVYNGDLIVGGQFKTAGGQTVNNVARWDGSEWHPLESGGQVGVGHVNSLAVHDGDLIVGGFMSTAGGKTVNSIARWDGSEWHSLGPDGQVGVIGTVYALTVYNGDLIAGGSFSHVIAGWQTVNYIARWDGSEWHPLVSSGGQPGVKWPGVYALTTFNDDLIVGGGFTTAGGANGQPHRALGRR